MIKPSQESVERRERRIDEALKETFPASDTPSFVGAGARALTDDKADKPDQDQAKDGKRNQSTKPQQQKSTTRS